MLEAMLEGWRGKRVLIVGKPDGLCAFLTAMLEEIGARLMRVGDRADAQALCRALTAGRIGAVILPEEIEALAIEPGKDYVTLMTCTPYAVTTHRLLVRGVRVPDDAPTPEPVSEPEKEPLDARRMLQNVVLPATAGILVVIMTVLLLKVVRGGRREK